MELSIALIIISVIIFVPFQLLLAITLWVIYNRILKIEKILQNVPSLILLYENNIEKNILTDKVLSCLKEINKYI